MDAVTPRLPNRDPAEEVITALERAAEKLEAASDKISSAATTQMASVVIGQELPRAMDRLVRQRWRKHSFMQALAGTGLMLIGLGIGWWVFSPPSGYTCAVQHGGYVCYAWLKPATQPATQPPSSAH